MEKHRRDPQSGTFADQMEAGMNTPDGIVYNGKRLQDLTTDEYIAYLQSPD